MWFSRQPFGATVKGQETRSSKESVPNNFIEREKKVSIEKETITNPSQKVPKTIASYLCTLRM